MSSSMVDWRSPCLLVGLFAPERRLLENATTIQSVCCLSKELEPDVKVSLTRRLTSNHRLAIMEAYIKSMKLNQLFNSQKLIPHDSS